MPTYEYICERCRREFEETVPASLRNDVKCSVCGELAVKQISAFNASTFTPFACENFGTDPVWIESKNQLREENKKRGLETIM
ncbi:hypothetical protein CMI37_01090 [Candidatus Pacearchaeota archaeon]|nr:hypothetical protein [Candidatus Pacearchaeota archaeon]